MRRIGKAGAYVLGFGVLLAAVAASAQDVVIVANRSIVSRITSSQLRDIFTGARSRLSDGTMAIPVVLKGGPVHEVFLRNHLGQAPGDFRTLWRKAVFTGQGSMLKEFDSEAGLLDYVAVTPGAIGYASRVRATDDVQVLTVSR
jgi:ABC-type phosphate transport system substrate-binding protein